MGLGEASFQSSWGGPSILQIYGFRKFGVPFRLINKDLGIPVVPFCPFWVLGSLIEYTNRKKGTLIVIRLLGYQGIEVCWGPYFWRKLPSVHRISRPLLNIGIRSIERPCVSVV